jgi:hypothetical protein
MDANRSQDKFLGLGDRSPTARLIQYSEESTGELLTMTGNVARGIRGSPAYRLVKTGAELSRVHLTKSGLVRVPSPPPIGLCQKIAAMRSEFLRVESE